jgi:A/G-specific adenine glycosylase
MTAALAGQLLRWFDHNRRDLPWRRAPSPYRTLVSELMLQQTGVATVVPYFQRFVARFPDFATLAAAREEEVTALWSGLGYYARARNLRRAAIAVGANHGGVRRLPGAPPLRRHRPGIDSRPAAGEAAARRASSRRHRVRRRRTTGQGSAGAAATRRAPGRHLGPAVARRR